MLYASFEGRLNGFELDTSTKLGSKKKKMNFNVGISDDQ